MIGNVSGNDKRIFINPTLGCDSNCSYCYLGSQGFDIGKKTSPPVAASFLYESLINFPGFKSGKAGSIVSIGCYSECWSVTNLDVTTKFIEIALGLGNPIQLATKRKVSAEQLNNIERKILWPGQLSIFLSCTTITQWRVYEKGTASPKNRFSEVARIKKMGIKVCLYIKPVLNDITILDLDLFHEVVKTHAVPIVVGEIFFHEATSYSGELKAAPIPSSGLYVQKNDQQIEILEFFRNKGYIAYQSSVEMVNHWRAE